ncbi:MAG: hypothetical protein JNK72_00485 [Myxococcales bacterium]|nr:hypothetical protein [Myxococcales bacterium]
MRAYLTLGSAVVTMAALLTGCVGAADDVYGDGDGEGAPVSAQAVGELTVGGYYCPTRGEIAGRDLPSDNNYYVTTFGGPGDAQRTACGGYANGRSLYIAGSWRFGCGARVRVTNPRTGRWCVAEVNDVGPNICVERAARKPIIDASPVVTRELFGVSSAGWSDRILVNAVAVNRATPLGCGSGTPPSAPSTGSTGSTGSSSSSATCFSGTLNRTMPYATCLQSRFDNLWYQCTSIGWIQSSAIASQRRGSAGACSQYLPR